MFVKVKILMISLGVKMINHPIVKTSRKMTIKMMENHLRKKIVKKINLICKVKQIMKSIITKRDLLHKIMKMKTLMIFPS